jgi:AcrR family transcriptional regulator
MEAKPPRRTRERILELSLKLFNDIGEPNVTTTTIAEEMEISPGNLYYHFRNKDDIINSIFAQFEQLIEKRLRFPEDHRPTIDEMWSYLQYMADFLWQYRFLYRDLNDLLARNRTLETHFKQIITTRSTSPSNCATQLVADHEMVATPAEIKVIATNMGVIATYWLSYQFVMNPRKYNEQETIRSELHQASLQIISMMAPYLRGRSRQIFDDLVSGKMPERVFADYRAPKEDGAPKEPKDVNESSLRILRLRQWSQTGLCRSSKSVRPRVGGSGSRAGLRRRERGVDGHHRR